MKHIQKASRRLVRQLKAIDKQRFRTAFEKMLTSYGVQPTALIQFPRLWSVCDERVYSRHGSLLYATAGSAMPNFYVRGIMRGARRAPFELVLAHVYCHEMFHYLGRRDVERVSLIGNSESGKESFELVRSISGFQLDTMIKNKGIPMREECAFSAFHFFNEGVTELLARDFFAKWAPRLRLRNVRKYELSRYVLDMEDQCGFYPSAVKFVRALLCRFALSSEVHPQTVLDWLVQAYAAGTDLRTDETWQMYVKRAKLPDDFTRRLENATEAQLDSLREDGLVRKIKINPVFGHDFDDIVVI